MDAYTQPVDLILTHRGVVYPWQCDQMGHMNVMWYVGKFDEATWQMFARMGLTPEFMRSSQCGMAAIRQEITYRRELRPGDIVSIWTAVLEMRERMIRFYHEMRDDASGEVAAATRITGVYMDLIARKARPFPQEILENGLAMVVDYTPVM
jgi:acyl-CoA thioester hydrolase